MVHEIGFPALNLEFSINREAFSVFGISIYWYGIIICLGFVLGALYLNTRVEEFGATKDDLLNCLLICVPSGIIGARIYYVVFEWSYYKDNLLQIFNTRSGGLALYGSVIGAFIGLFVYSKVKKLSFVTLCDLAAMGFLVGQFVGRWGNFVNGEAHGDVTTLPWGMTIDGSAPVHPTFLYESLWNFIGFLFIHFYSKRRKFKGEIVLSYIAWYGLGRVWIEGLRTDSLYMGSFRISQVVAGVSCVVAVLLIVRQRSRIRVQNAFYVPTPSQAEAEAETEVDGAKEEPRFTEAEASDNAEMLDASPSEFANAQGIEPDLMQAEPKPVPTQKKAPVTDSVESEPAEGQTPVAAAGTIQPKTLAEVAEENHNEAEAKETEGETPE